MIPKVQQVFMSVAFTTASCHSVMANEASCEQIADETILEMKAGANDWWTEDIARMAGMAAASACFKTKSRLSAAPSEPEPDRETGKFMGLQVEPLSGPPSRKPYQRTNRD